MSAREAGRAAAVKVYERFHQAEPDKDLRVNVPGIPANMTLLGQMEALTYSVPDGVPSKRAHVRWKHEAGDLGERSTGAKPYIFAHPTEPMLVIVPKPGDPPFELTDRGIVG